MRGKKIIPRKTEVESFERFEKDESLKRTAVGVGVSRLTKI